MKVSVHNKYLGGFDYYDVPDTVPVNDDFPTPKLSQFRTKLGVPATQAGRPLPAGARAAGRGEVPVGLISSGKRGSWSSGGGDILPSGLGAIHFDMPCPSKNEAAVAGAALGALVHAASSSKSTVRGILLTGAGAALAYLYSERVCFWR